MRLLTATVDPNLRQPILSPPDYYGTRLPFNNYLCKLIPVGLLVPPFLFLLLLPLKASIPAVASTALALAMNEASIATLKALIPHPRPNFYALCKYEEAAAACTAPPYLVRAALKSFPSGRASGAFTAYTLLGLYIPRLKLPAALLAVYVSYLRVAEHWHHMGDVIGGGLVGGFWAWMSWGAVGRKRKQKTD